MPRQCSTSKAAAAFLFFFLPAAASTSLSARFFARRLDPLEMAVFLSPGERLKGISKSGGGGGVRGKMEGAKVVTTLDFSRGKKSQLKFFF